MKARTFNRLTYYPKYYIEKGLPFDADGKILVKKGASIASYTVLARAKITPERKVIPVAQILDVAPDRIQDFLKLKLGQNALKGDILAEKKFLGLALKKVIAPFSGILEKIDNFRGTISWVKPWENLDILSHVEGKVVKSEERVALIETSVWYLRGAAGKSYAEGELSYLEDLDSFSTGAGASLAGKILAVTSISPDTFEKAKALGAKGLVVPYISFGLFSSQKFPILVISAFGRGMLNESERKFFQRYSGKMAILDGESRAFLVPAKEKRPVRKGEDWVTLKKGDAVLTFIWPYWGREGKVVRIIPKARLYSGLEADAVEVLLPEEKVICPAESILVKP